MVLVNLADVASRINSIQVDLAISSPETVTIKRVYPYFPKSSEAIPTADTPCFINTWTMPGVNFGPALQLGSFTWHMNLLIDHPDTNRAAAIATAFLPQIVTAFGANLKLGGSGPVWVKTLRGADPTLARLEFGGKPYIGLDLYLDLGISSAQVLEP